MSIIQISLILSLPFIVLRLEERVFLIKKLSPIVVCYALGILLGNIPFIEWNETIPTSLAEISVPLAIPLLLFGTDIPSWLRGARPMIISFSLVIVSVLIVSYISTFLFSDTLEPLYKSAAMIVGIYTGGTPNLSAIGLSLNVDNYVFVALNAADIIWGAFFLLFILTIGKKWLLYLLPAYSQPSESPYPDDSTSWVSLNRSKKVVHIGVYLLTSGLFLGLSFILSQVFFAKTSVAFIILVITTLGALGSLIRRVRIAPGTYETGNYLLLCFCIAVGSLANIEQLVSSSGIYLAYTAFCMFGAISLHFFLCKLFSIDRDTALITSVAGIYGPAFVAPVANNLGNKALLIGGLTSGLIGYAVGNYLGLALYYLLTS